MFTLGRHPGLNPFETKSVAGRGWHNHPFSSRTPFAHPLCRGGCARGSRSCRVCPGPRGVAPAAASARSPGQDARAPTDAGVGGGAGERGARGGRLWGGAFPGGRAKGGAVRALGLSLLLELLVRPQTLAVTTSLSTLARSSPTASEARVVQDLLLRTSVLSWRPPPFERISQ